MSRAHVAAVNDNYRAAFESLASSQPGGAVQQFGSITVASSMFPAPIYNQAFVFEPPVGEDVHDAVAWLRQREIPFWVTAAEDARGKVSTVAEDLDIERVDETPGMVRPAMTAIPNPDTDAEITEVVDEPSLDEFIPVAATVFSTPEEIADQAYRSALDDDAIRLFLGRIESKAVACGMLFETGPVAGIYTMGVLETARRRGIGKAMASELLRVGREGECDVAALQSTDMAKPLYEELGFETVTTYHHFESVD